MKQKINIAIVDDHQIVIDGLKLLLSNETQFDIVADFTDGLQLLNELKQLNIDILLTDIMMPSLSGYELALLVKNQFPHIKIIALSMNGEGSLIHKMIDEAEIKGYLLKTSNKQVLIEAIQMVAAGHLYFPEEIINEMNRFEKLKKDQQQVHLTARELEIIKFIATDYTNKQIAQELFISERTVETHRKNIFRKTDTHSVISLVEFARKMGFI